MKNISNNISDTYTPYKALLIYQSKSSEEGNEQSNIYVESYDINKNGNPVNAHPLSLKESIDLAEMLEASQEVQNNFLKTSGVIPSNLLYVNPAKNGYAIWHTPIQQKELYFVESLGIKSGFTYLPSLVWVASRDVLFVYAIKGNRKPNCKTQLYHPPFFNTYGNGQVCMGNVNIQIDRGTHLEKFMNKWEQYFYNSYFSHTLANGSNVKGNIVQLWQKQMNSGQKFPEESLVKNEKTVQSLIK